MTTTPPRKVVCELFSKAWILSPPELDNLVAAGEDFCQFLLSLTYAMFSIDLLITFDTLSCLIENIDFIFIASIGM